MAYSSTSAASWAGSQGHDYSYSNPFGSFNVHVNPDGSQTRLQTGLSAGVVHGYFGNLTPSRLKEFPVLASRVLTKGEISMLVHTLVMLNPTLVNLFEMDLGWWPQGTQAFTLGNNIYVNYPNWSWDYSLGSDWEKAVFVHESQNVADNQHGYGGGFGGGYQVDIHSSKISKWNTLPYEPRAVIIGQYRLALDGWSGWSDYLGNPVYDAKDYVDFIK
jgi:hypothetical protein